MSYRVNRLAKFELENFKCVVEIFGLSIDLRTMLLDQKCSNTSSIARSCLLCSVASIVTFGSIWDPVINIYICLHYLHSYVLKGLVRSPSDS